MKKYYEIMNEISSDELYKGLLGYGMFNSKLPPFLTSTTFYDYCQAYKPIFNTSKKPQNYIYYENMRNINIPRSLGIPNPFVYQRLCSYLKDNWDSILTHFEKHTKNDKHKISRIHIRKMKDTNMIFEMNYKDYRSDGSPEPDLLMGSKYMVNADVSTCFPSMYTHSLAWALVGKDVAKANKNNHKEWYNDLDFCVRNTTNGETHGLLIGPHTSNILSEIILTSVDNELSKRDWKYIRNVDDYTCYVSSYEDGQTFLVELSEQLRNYKLILNHKKTKITPLPMASVEHWVRELNVYSNFFVNKSMDYKDVKSFLDLSIKLMHISDDSAILNYSLKIISSKKLSSNAVDYFVNTIFHLSIIYPYLIPLLDENVFKVFNVKRKRMNKFINLIYHEGMLNNNFENVSYAIYFALKYGLNINFLDFDRIRNSNHSILHLLSFLYCEHYNISTEVKKFKKLARELNKDNDDLNQNWVFVYEALPKSDLKSDWKILKDNNVSFVNDFILSGR